MGRLGELAPSLSPRCAGGQVGARLKGIKGRGRSCCWTEWWFWAWNGELGDGWDEGGLDQALWWHDLPS